MQTEVGEGASLALGLLQAEIIDEADFVRGDDPATFVARSIGRLWTPEGLDDFGYSYTLTTLDDQIYFVVELEQAHYLDFSPVAALCDGLHDQLGPSLLSHLYRVLPLTPSFTPEVCFEHIVMSHWCGWDGAEELLEMARNDLSYAQGVTEESLSDAEVETYADSHYLTPNHVAGLLGERYRRRGTLAIAACRALCPLKACPNLNTVFELLGKLTELADALPKRAESFYERFEGEDPFALIVGLQRGSERDLVEEIYREHEDLVWNSGFDFAPVYALGVDVNDTTNLVTLQRALETCKKSLELTQKLELLPPHILAVSPERLVWFESARDRVMFFETTDPYLQKLSGTMCPHPALLFIAGERSLKVFALQSDDRPLADAEVYAAPYYNTSRGGVCLGSTPLPATLSVDDTESYSDAFFHSAFTHGTAERLLKGWGGLMASVGAQLKRRARFFLNTLYR